MPYYAHPYVAHGDLYHNIMFGGSDSETVAATLCDFGASTYYHGINKCIADKFERIEVLAFGNGWKIYRALFKLRMRRRKRFTLQKIEQCQDHSVSSDPRCLG